MFVVVTRGRFLVQGFPSLDSDANRRGLLRRAMDFLLLGLREVFLERRACWMEINLVGYPVEWGPFGFLLLWDCRNIDGVVFHLLANLTRKKRDVVLCYIPETSQNTSFVLHSSSTFPDVPPSVSLPLVAEVLGRSSTVPRGCDWGQRGCCPRNPHRKHLA